MNVGLNKWERAARVQRRDVSIPVRRPEFWCTRWRVPPWPSCHWKRTCAEEQADTWWLHLGVWFSPISPHVPSLWLFWVGVTTCRVLWVLPGVPNSQEGLELNVKHNIDFSLWKILKVLVPLYMMCFIIWKFSKVAIISLKSLKEQIIKGKDKLGY